MWRTISSTITRNNGIVQVSVCWKTFIWNLSGPDLNGVQVVTDRMKLQALVSHVMIPLMLHIQSSHVPSGVVVPLLHSMADVG